MSLTVISLLDSTRLVGAGMLRKSVGVLLLALFSGCAVSTANTQAEGFHDDWFGRDKLYHFAAAGAIGAAATMAAVNNHSVPCNAVSIGISTAFVFGVGKEWYDVNFKKTFFSWKDMVWDIAGGTLGSLAVADCR